MLAFIILPVTIGIALCFFIDIFLQSDRQVRTGLVGQISGIRVPFYENFAERDAEIENLKKQLQQ